MGMVRGCLVGAVVTLALIALPVVHWVTFIPAPFIGGYFAGTRTRVTDGRVFLVGLVMGLLLLVPVVGILSLTSLMFLHLTVRSMAIAAGVYVLYVAALGSLGAVVGGASARRHAPPEKA